MPVQTAPRIEVPQRRGDPGPLSPQPAKAKVSVRGLNFFYGRVQALHDISVEIPERIVMAFIGPSGCGKSTFLRTLNRMNDVIPPPGWKARSLLTIAIFMLQVLTW